jgi:hypothetical protein
MSTLVSDIINLAFLDIGGYAAGEVITTAEQADAFLRLNMLMSSLSTEQLTLHTVVHQAFTPVAGTAAYTLGTAGSLVTAAQPVRVTGWSSLSGNFRNGGVPVSFAEFESRALNPTARTSVLAEMVAADMGFPSINLKLFPTPAAGPGSLELDYWIPLTQFTAVTDVVTLPDGWLDMLHFNLALRLYPQYPREGGIDPVLAANAQNSKLSIVAKNAAILGQQQAAAPPDKGQANG